MMVITSNKDLEIQIKVGDILQVCYISIILLLVT